MQMQPVDSTHIAAIGHDGKETMHVQYFSVNGKGKSVTYAHSPVTAADHAKIMERIGKGESAGKIIRNLEPRGVRLSD
jgi:hypothetical protein